MRLRRGWLLIGVLVHAAGHGEVIRFDRAEEGAIPPGWVVGMTHTGAPPRWQIVRDDSSPHPPKVLAQVSNDGTAGRFPLAIWDRATLRNGEVSVAFKAVDGKVDRAAGIVWRYKDPNNYYIVRANALENNVVLYKVEGGVRLSIAPKGLPSRAYGVQHEIRSSQWTTLRVRFRDKVFSVYLNGEHLFDAEDQTFTDAGKVGLWTKADSITYFADFTYNEQ